MDRGAWQAAVHGVAKSQTWLSDFTFTFHFDALEKEMETHSSVLAWRIPGMGSHRVRQDWSDLAVATACNSYAMSEQGVVVHCTPYICYNTKDEFLMIHLKLMTSTLNGILISFRNLCFHFTHLSEKVRRQFLAVSLVVLIPLNSLLFYWCILFSF